MRTWHAMRQTAQAPNLQVGMKSEPVCQPSWQTFGHRRAQTLALSILASVWPSAISCGFRSKSRVPPPFKIVIKTSPRPVLRITRCHEHCPVLHTSTPCDICTTHQTPFALLSEPGIVQNLQVQLLLFIVLRSVINCGPFRPTLGDTMDSRCQAGYCAAFLGQRIL